MPTLAANVRYIAPRESYRIKKVAAYARVSTNKEEQEESFETQCNYYEQYIQSNKDWRFVKVFSDHGFSGVSAENRPGFMEMMSAAESKEFKLLLVKSISRFARNVVEAQTYCRKLKLLGVEVRFERESISTFDPSSEMAFNLMASIAQEESRSISERTQWGIHERMKKGIYHLGNNKVLGYDEVNGELVPNKDAWIIAKVFEQYVKGVPVGLIAKEIDKKGFTGIAGGKTFSTTHIYYIIQNPIYVGDRHLQKQPPKNYMTHKPDESRAYDSFYIRNCHKGVIERNVWDEAQRKVAAEDELRKLGVRKRYDSHFLYGKVFCGLCGHAMKRKTAHTAERPKIWECSDRLKGKKGNGCTCDTIREDYLIPGVCEQLCVSAEDLEENIGKIDRIVVRNQNVAVLTYAK